MREFTKLFWRPNKLREARTKLQNLSSRERKYGLKSSDRKKMDHARETIRREIAKVLGRWGLLIGGGIVSVSVSSKFCSSAPLPIQKSESRINQPKLPDVSPQDFRAAVEFQNTQKEQTKKALEKFKDFNEKTRQLFMMFNDHARFSIPMGPRITRRIETDTPVFHPHDFEVTFILEQYLHTMPSSIVWQPSENILRVASNITSNDWLAIFLYHELSHVWDFHFGGENPSDRRQWIEGEVRAHKFECELIDQWQPEAYKRFLAEGIPLWRRGEKDKILDLGDALFPKASYAESIEALKHGAFLTCVAFADAREQNRDLHFVYETDVLSHHHRPLQR